MNTSQWGTSIDEDSRQNWSFSIYIEEEQTLGNSSQRRFQSMGSLVSMDPNWQGLLSAGIPIHKDPIQLTLYKD